MKMNEEGYDTGLGEPARRAMDEYSEVDDEDEMVATERELAEDAQWKKIQQNTFTRWANEHLKTVEKHIGNLETDLSDGLRLITLIEVLSGRRLPKHNKRPSFRSQKLENVSVALKFLQDEERIRIVNIGERCYNIHLVFWRRSKTVPSEAHLVTGIATGFFTCECWYTRGHEHSQTSKVDNQSGKSRCRLDSRNEVNNSMIFFF